MKFDAEYQTMLDEVCAGQASTGERSAHLLRLLRDAEQAHRPWARDAIDDATQAGLAKTIKAHQKATGMVTVRKAPKSTVVGVQREGRWHQVSLADATWDEISMTANLAKSNIKALRSNLRLIERLIELHEKHPNSVGPGDALRMEGTTLDAYLAAA